jgi:hypothetical protein
MPQQQPQMMPGQQPQMMPGIAPSALPMEANALAVAGAQMFRTAVHATTATNAFVRGGTNGDKGIESKLLQLEEMRNQGVLSNEQYDQAKQRLVEQQFANMGM